MIVAETANSLFASVQLNKEQMQPDSYDLLVEELENDSDGTDDEADALRTYRPSKEMYFPDLDDDGDVLDDDND